jgi:hypothetical protein
MSLVTVETRKVYRAEGRWFLRPSAAYYAIAKAMVVKKYPRRTKGGDEESDAACYEMTLELWRERQDKADALFFDFGVDSYGEPTESFDSARWQAFVRRLARFLRYVDERRNDSPEPKPHGRAESPPGS